MQPSMLRSAVLAIVTRGGVKLPERVLVEALG